ncbi:bifunctional demethylmenaquinone methyltransferase/2-methoxy-6-polyprenyl-1,4-benzoquinol methylase UbiE [Candidatus Sumerlaeota bacterium]|nr:bifunctional demethylmenaquinone methyltransferase/2-methoxy-6-polyprenyl-1,4-benzoquinol methylase UbiE [Candidatus Sumerlaeota bacterium]
MMVDKSAERIREMFNSLAPCYDRMNRLMTFRQDQRWRRRLVRMALTGAPRPACILDLCAGTGDLALGFAAVARTNDSIIAVDFAEALLERAREKAKVLRNGAVRPECIRADALNMPFDDASFDIVSVGFGVRNFEDLERGLREIHRVLRPGGRLYVLETSHCEIPILRYAVEFYTRRVIPAIGRMISGTQAYGYLRDSAGAFPDRREFSRILEQCGFANVRAVSLSFGAAAIHIGEAGSHDQ